MGHTFFMILHLLALVFGIVGLIITIPLHLIYSALSKQGKKEENKKEESIGNQLKRESKDYYDQFKKKLNETPKENTKDFQAQNWHK